MSEQVVILTQKVYEEIQRKLNILNSNFATGRVVEDIKRALYASPHVVDWDWDRIPGLRECGAKGHWQCVYWMGDGPCPECERRK